jgi:hypothetical protein
MQTFYQQWKAVRPYEVSDEAMEEARVFAKFSLGKLKAASKNDRNAINLYKGE